MWVPLLFARRYLVSKKSSTAINILTWVSVTGVCVGSLGLILVLSVFNGFRNVVVSLYNTFYPDFIITAVEGKSFVPDSVFLDQLRKVPSVRAVSMVIEENALLAHGDRQSITRIKGVDEGYDQLTGLASAVFDGQFLLTDSLHNYVVLGAGVAQTLGVAINDPFSRIFIYIPKKKSKSVFNPVDAFHREIVKPAGRFAIQSDFDLTYAFVPLALARRLTELPQGVTALEIAIHEPTQMAATQKTLTQLAGPSLKVLNRYQQNETLYRVMNMEKWAVYAILTLILIVASFNIVGSLSMLVIEKKRDISLLKALGAPAALIRNIFLLVGILISLLGFLIGSVSAVGLIFLQQQFGLLKIGGSFVVSAYPVHLRADDLLLVFATVLAIGIMASWYPAQRAAATYLALKTY